MSLRLRPFTPADSPLVARVRTAAGARGWWGGDPGWFGSDQLLGTQLGILRLAVDDGGTFAGYGVCWLRHGSEFGLDLAVAPGEADAAVPDLLVEVERWVRCLDGTAIETRVNAASTALVAALERNAFAEMNRLV